MSDTWAAHLAREEARYRDGEARLDPSDADSHQRQLTRLGNAANGAGLALLMQGRSDEAATWFERAAGRYRESFPEAPPASWGRPIGAVKALVLAGDWEKAEEAARWALETGAPEAESPIGRYAAAVEAVLASFETRDEYLEDLPVADTVLVLQALAERRGMTADLDSPLLPTTGASSAGVARP